MALSRPEEILAALAGGTPRQLLGTAESSQIDFKIQPYALNSDKGKWELAKDVAGLANFRGGILVVGVRTEKDAGNFLEIAAELRPVPLTMLDGERHHKIIRDLVRPAVTFNVAYSPDPGEITRGYMTIHVEQLDEFDRFALVRRMTTIDDKPTESFGVPIRDGAQTRWLSGDEVYRYLRDGQRASKTILPNSIDMSQPTHSTEPSGISSIIAEEDIRSLISFKEWDQPVLAWQSLPTRPVDLTKRMWGQQGISGALRNHPSLRDYGFNWYFLAEPVPLDDGVLTSDGRHAIWVRENGTITAAAPIKQDDMLTWAMGNPSEGPYKINLIALIEMTLEYYRLVDGFILPGTNIQYQHVISTIGFAEKPGVILPSALPKAISMSQNRATRDVRREFQGSSNPEHEAYEALAFLYAAFQYSPQSIPFSADGQIEAQQLVEYARNN
jgi:hypothetical protein